MELRKRFKSILFLILLLSVFSQIRIYSQSNNPYTPKIVPPSPNAAALAKFGDMPVSTYTGTTEISVPIYTIAAKGVSVPIGLSYHTGGIRLAEEAGWVGLGWALNAGGMISRTVNDKDDLTGGYYNSDLAPAITVPEIKGILQPRTPYEGEEYFGPWTYVFACRYKVYTDVNTYNLYDFWYRYFNAVDNEPDSYSFNFPGHSGKFIIGRDHKVILQKQENLKIEPATDGSSFIITDDQGNKYYFIDKEYSQPATGGAQQISSWLLSKIVTQQKDSVIFNYYSDNTWTLVQGIKHESYRKGVPNAEGMIYANDPGQYYLNKTLQSIDYTNAQVQFSFDANRNDLSGGKKLNAIKIFSKDQTGLRYLKEEQLYYSYFQPGAINSIDFYRLRLDSVKEVSGTVALAPYKFDYNMPATMQSLMGKHYSSVDHWGYFNGKSNAVNGDYTIGFLPPFLGLANVGGSNLPAILDLPGANREPDSSFMKAFSLSKVTYPTGGSTQLDYESNYYDYFNSTSGYQGKDFEYIPAVTKTAQYIINTNGTTNGTIDLSHLYYSIPNGVAGTNLTVSIAFRAASSDSLNKYHNTFAFGKIGFTFQSNTTDIISNSLYCNGTMSNGNCSGTVYSYAYDIAMPTKTTYSWSAYIDPSVRIGGGLQDIVVTFTWKEASIYNSTMLMAGGLRIKSITDYRDASTIAKKRTYDYSYQQDRNNDGINETYSYGREMGYVSYARYEILDLSGTGGAGLQPGNHGTSLTRYSSSNTSFTSQSSGNIVGYDQVTEYTFDPITGADVGKTVYTYNNSSDTSLIYGGYKFPGMQSIPNNLNGLLKLKKVFARSGSNYNPVASSSYFYHSSNRTVYDASKFQLFRNLTPGSVQPVTCMPPNMACNCPNQIDSTGLYMIDCFYPALCSEVVLLDSTVEKTYDQNDTTKQLIAVTRNYYDNPKHYQISRSSSIDSKHNTLVSFIRYPQDYIPNGNTQTGNTILDSLINKNMVASTIEKRDSFYYSGSSSGYVRGAQLSIYKVLSSGSVAIDKQYMLNLSTPTNDFVPFAVNSNTTSQDSRYRQMISVDNYDNTYNIIQYTTTDQLPTSFVWDYKNLYPIAQVKNAVQSDIAYTSFEADGTGGWSGVNTANVQNATGLNGNKYYSGSFSISKSALTAGKTYIVSYWSNNGAYTITGTVSGYPKTFNAITRGANTWTYYEHQVTGQSTITISGSGGIDELRLFPKGALMSTYTYQPLIGTTSQCDPSNRLTYFDYDPFGRLFAARDQNSSIFKKYSYSYAGQPEYNLTYGNTSQSGTYTRVCGAGYSGTQVMYTVPANTYYSFTQASADSAARNDVAANGQNYANANGTCIAMATITGSNSKSISYTVKFTKSSDSNVWYSFSLPVGANNSTLGQIPQDTYNVQFQPNGNPPLANFNIGSYTLTNATGATFNNVSITTATLARVY